MTTAKIYPLISYALINENDEHLTLQYGRVMDDNGNVMSGVKEQRWRFLGTHIPMPVRSNTWFEGLSTREMLAWLYEAGYELQARVNLSSGVVYAPKGNKEPKREVPGLSDVAISLGEKALQRAIRCMCNDNLKLNAIALYRYFNGGTLQEARNAVTEICELDEQK